MDELRLLIVNQLENVKNANEASNAKLCNKENLTDLSLVWHDIVDVALAEKVLDNLQPHNSLKKLKIHSYAGVRSAIWMNNIDLISHLEHIELKHCLEWQTLPPFGQLPFLKSLYLLDMPNVKQFNYKVHGNDEHCLFPSLEVLHFWNLKEMEDWFGARAAADGHLFPCLTELYLKDCPKLQELPSLPPMLEKLEIDSIGWEGFNWLQGTGNGCSISIQNLPNLFSLTGLQEVDPTGNSQLTISELDIEDPSILLREPLRSITSFRSLIISGNDALVSFPNETEQWFQQVRSSLCELEFCFLHSLKILPSYFESLSSLKILRVRKIPQLQLLPNIPASLERLELVELESLQSLPSSLESVSSLKILLMEKIPQLQLLPIIPASLEELQLVELEYLQSLPSSLESVSSLKILRVEKVPQLQLLPNIPTSLEQLRLVELESLQSLPSSLESLSSLKILHMENVLLLQLLPNIPASLERLELKNLESLWCLPSSMSFSSLKYLELIEIPLQTLPDLPPSLCDMQLVGLKHMNCLPSCLHTLSSLRNLHIIKVPQLKEVPDLPPSLCELYLIDLPKLDCLPPCLSSLSSLQILEIANSPQLRRVPDLPPSLRFLSIKNDHR